MSPPHQINQAKPEQVSGEQLPPLPQEPRKSQFPANQDRFSRYTDTRIRRFRRVNHATSVFAFVLLGCILGFAVGVTIAVFMYNDMVTIKSGWFQAITEFIRGR
jgi:hypothetical protein